MHYGRVVGFDDPEITGAALLGLGEARYRLDDDDARPRVLGGRDRSSPRTRSTYLAWRNVAAARVRGGDLPGRHRRLSPGRSPRAARGQGRRSPPASAG